MTSDDKPQILLLSLAHRDYLDVLYHTLLSRLYEAAHIKRAKHPTAALREMAENTFKAIIITDEALAESCNVENMAVPDKVKEYVHQGGLVIVGLHFPRFASSGIENFFHEFGLSWSDVPEGTAVSMLHEAYSMNATLVKNARVRKRVYVPIEAARPGFLGFPAQELVMEQTPIAAARVGQGHLVYCGDINREAGSTCLILALCGIQTAIDADLAESQAARMVTLFRRRM
ncbi:hypothetical protein ASPVEDRAFT_203049 [Aspergillus versicolor CBS 583.65]|uniref:ThuA-like domain-containing protein n=1 Tax=Aspergillus versicolor CBS 583.65 TaxID=1036611 RepID=A0A1L9Q2D1_ASPVE|nr:uncharacterized protein ASPVEDRAFT_203049 [Aspergillus versicolor CBS 583.65]OJJ07930.1 hypothetical protein ASPVEDRAFT_203049 [Aspergillus versicolor CBS 583.65]